MITPFVGFHIDLTERGCERTSLPPGEINDYWWPFEYQTINARDASCAGDGHESLYRYGYGNGNGTGKGHR